MFLKRLDRTKKNIPGLRYEMTGPPALDAPSPPAHPARDETPVYVSKTYQFFHLPRSPLPPSNPPPPLKNTFTVQPYGVLFFFFLQADWFISQSALLRGCDVWICIGFDLITSILISSMRQIYCRFHFWAAVFWFFVVFFLIVSDD